MQTYKLMKNKCVELLREFSLTGNVPENFKITREIYNFIVINKQKLSEENLGSNSNKVLFIKGCLEYWFISPTIMVLLLTIFLTFELSIGSLFVLGTLFLADCIPLIGIVLSKSDLVKGWIFEDSKKVIESFIKYYYGELFIDCLLDNTNKDDFAKLLNFVKKDLQFLKSNQEKGLDIELQNLRKILSKIFIEYQNSTDIKDSMIILEFLFYLTNLEIDLLSKGIRVSDTFLEDYNRKLSMLGLSNEVDSTSVLINDIKHLISRIISIGYPGYEEDLLRLLQLAIINLSGDSLQTIFYSEDDLLKNFSCIEKEVTKRINSFIDVKSGESLMDTSININSTLNCDGSNINL